MVNSFLSNYYDRLRDWFNLKESIRNSKIQIKCIEVDKFWQQCPMSNHFLHPADIESWPNPWELLNDNTYCYYARALGMVYTLMLLGVQDIDLIEGIDDTATEVVLVVVNKNFVLNYWPNSVLTTNLSGFTIQAKLNTDSLKNKLGNQ